jgi:ABC-type transport system involved in multi-copper enzyme maturation permease subunit
LVAFEAIGTHDMPLGPVFERELMVTARRGRAYALRSACGLALLAVLLATARHSASYQERGAGAVGRIALELFQNLLLVQGIAIVFLTPALVSGAIAEENQGKTLHELLTSDLTGAEIVVGKLSARLSHVAVLAATGLPLLLLAGLLGGVDLSLVFASAGATLSTAFFLGGLSILASTQTRSVRGAMNFTYTMALSWLILPGAIEVLLPRGAGPGLAVYSWVEPINAWIAPTTPFALWIDLTRGAFRGPAPLLERVAWMVGLQCLYGASLTALAVASLRPSFRAREGGRRGKSLRDSVAGVRRPVRQRPRPRCGDDPMLWKELLVPRTPAFYRPLGMLTALILGGLLAWTTARLATPAFNELRAGGYGLAPSGSARATFHFYLRIVGTGIAVVYLLGVASDAAAGLTSEREKDTWISLVATPLTGTEIIRAKMLGAIWNIRQTALVLVGLWLLGVLAGSVHPLGLLAVLAELAAFTWFTAALGTWISLRSGHTMWALARVMASLLLLNGGSLLVALPLLSARPLALAGCAPLLMAASLASYGDVRGAPATGSLGLMSDSSLAAFWVGRGPEMALACSIGVLGSAVGAFVLTRSACRGFDGCLDRPTVSGPSAGEDFPDGVPARPGTRLGTLRRPLNRGTVKSGRRSPAG